MQIVHMQKILARFFIKFLVIMASLMIFGLAAHAADLLVKSSQQPLPPTSTTPDWLSSTSSYLSEVRIGTLAHDPTSPEKGSADLNVEILSKKLWAGNNTLWDTLIPRLQLGGTANFVGKTSHAYTGLTWDYDLTKKIFVEASFGGDYNNGKTGPVAVSGHNALGCHVMFHENGSLGYHLTENWSIMATIEHISNAGFCTQNRGLTNYGVRLGYAF